VHMPQHLGPADRIDPGFLYGATTACRVSVLRELGGWNEEYRSNFEDVDLSQRIKKSGFKLLYAPACRAWHLRRDNLESVLRTFWNWNYFGYENLFATVESWLSGRLPSIWWRYRMARLDDLRHTGLNPVTLLLPWTWIIRDLHKLQARVGDIGRISDVAALAGSLLQRLGMETHAVAAFFRQLEQLTASLEPLPSRQPLRLDIANPIAVGALESIPDAGFWSRCNAEMPLSAEFQLPPPPTQGNQIRQ
jgi:hypothetical protein